MGKIGEIITLIWEFFPWNNSEYFLDDEYNLFNMNVLFLLIIHKIIRISTTIYCFLKPITTNI